MEQKEAALKLSQQISIVSARLDITNKIKKERWMTSCPQSAHLGFDLVIYLLLLDNAGIKYSTEIQFSLPSFSEHSNSHHYSA